MTTTINGLVILLIALIPGVPGEFIYTQLTGLDWREEQLRRVIRIVLVSVVGLILYVLLDDLLGGIWSPLDLPDPKYVMPAHLGMKMTRAALSHMAWAFIGHVLLATGVGWGLARGWEWAAERLETTKHPSAWDDLVNEHAPKHWVVITLTDETTWAGKIETADENVPAEERDLLLEEPARYDPEEDTFITEPYQHLFVPAALVATVAVLYDSDQDARVSDIGQSILLPTDNDANA